MNFVLTERCTGAKAQLQIRAIDAALKRRSSTVFHAFVSGAVSKAGDRRRLWVIAFRFHLSAPCRLRDRGRAALQGRVRS